MMQRILISCIVVYILPNGKIIAKDGNLYANHDGGIQWIVGGNNYSYLDERINNSCKKAQGIYNISLSLPYSLYETTILTPSSTFVSTYNGVVMIQHTPSSASFSGQYEVTSNQNTDGYIYIETDSYIFGTIHIPRLTKIGVYNYSDAPTYTVTSLQIYNNTQYTVSNPYNTIRFRFKDYGWFKLNTCQLNITMQYTVIYIA